MNTPRSFLFAVLTLLAACPPEGGSDGGTNAGDACPALNGEVVTHQSDITADETWAGTGQVHRVAFDVTVRPGATLTLGECARVKIIGGRGLLVSGDVATARPAKLVSAGKPGRRVTIESDTPTNRFSQLRAYNAQSFLDLSYTTISGGGGSTLPPQPVVWLQGAASFTALTKSLRMVDVVIDDAPGLALKLESATALTDDSTDVRISRAGGADQGVIELTPLALNSLPRTTTFSDNVLNEIKVTGTLRIERDVTVKALGASYHFVFDRVRVHSDSATPTLTVEAGTRLRFDDSLQIGYFNSGLANETAALVAVGTPGAGQIVFTSAKPAQAAGDWPGVFLFNAPGSRLENVVIEKAGGFNGISSANCKPPSSNDHAALFIGGALVPYQPTASNFVNVTVRQSASHGINAMWSAGGFGPDLTSGFSFDGIAGCRQTKNGRTTGCGTEAGCLVP